MAAAPNLSTLAKTKQDHCSFLLSCIMIRPASPDCDRDDSSIMSKRASHSLCFAISTLQWAGAVSTVQGIHISYNALSWMHEWQTHHVACKFLDRSCPSESLTKNSRTRAMERQYINALHRHPAICMLHKRNVRTEYQNALHRTY